jgi:hypothetical protein
MNGTCDVDNQVHDDVVSKNMHGQSHLCFNALFGPSGIAGLAWLVAATRSPELFD